MASLIFMDTSFFSLALLLIFISNIFTLSSSSDITTDQNALFAFKNTIIDPNGVLSSNWSSNTSVCKWIGISCSIKHQRVTALNLSGFALSGNLAPHLGNLTFLQSLDISSNSFMGSLPSELSELHGLNEINVRNNSLSGEIPSGIFTNMSVLIEINLRSNKLSGELPIDLCSNTPKLKILSLNYNQFSGKIPASIYKCTEMEDLQFYDNNFNGNIPAEIGNLSMLTTLDLSSNDLQGDIPSFIFNMSLLEYVYLSDNNLSGGIPIFHSLPKLQHLYLDSNKLTGHIPKQVGNLTSLLQFDLSSNQISGELPEELGNLLYLEGFFASFNDFLSGSIPPSIFNISTLRILSLQQNLFSGTLPPNTGLFLSNLEELYLFYNRLSGEIPSSITNASKLTVLELNRNSFTGSIPDFGSLRFLQVLRLWENNLTGVESPNQELGFLSSLTNCRDLKNLEISNNPLNGILPASVGNLSTSLETLSAFNCSINGVIPSQIANLKSLQALELSNNQLIGIIPTSIGKLEQLQGIYLRNNRLQGYIPHDLCQIRKLVELYLDGNFLTGPIHECFGDLGSLQKVYFASNKLNSTIPSNLWNLRNLVLLDLSFNNLSGELPNQIGNLKAINQLNLSSNQFSGDIPSSISGCGNLELLNFSNNFFSGSIPDSFEKVGGLRSLDLSRNNLSGSIPKSLEKLDLEYFNVSYNQLEGEIPSGGRFGNFTAQSFYHNFDLCGAAGFQVPPCKKNNGGRSRSKTVGLIMKYVVPPFIAVVILVIIIVYLIKRRKQKEMPAAAADISSVGVSWKIISERELAQGTSSFSEINLLGRGSFGSVFKGMLSDGTSVAVKVFDLRLEGASKSFETESQILSTIRHRNLIRILGCCSNTEFKALIIEYMPNGCLDKWLHSDKFVFDVVKRLSISIDVALALEYLHYDHTFTVVHCDIKPSNVLLDEDMTARVSDFGISKLFEDGEAATHTVTMATIGYAAPEFGSEGKISTSGDVYSYGILLLEIFTSKRPTDDMFGAEMSIKEWVEKALQENAIGEVVAPGLLSRGDRHFSAKEQCVLSIFDLAMKCLAFSPEERINMMQVVAALQKFKVTLEGIMMKHRRSG